MPASRLAFMARFSALACRCDHGCCCQSEVPKGCREDTTATLGESRLKQSYEGVAPLRGTRRRTAVAGKVWSIETCQPPGLGAPGGLRISPTTEPYTRIAALRARQTNCSCVCTDVGVAGLRLLRPRVLDVCQCCRGRVVATTSRHSAPPAERRRMGSVTSVTNSVLPALYP